MAVSIVSVAKAKSPSYVTRMILAGRCSRASTLAFSSMGKIASSTRTISVGNGVGNMACMYNGSRNSRSCGSKAPFCGKVHSSELHTSRFSQTTRMFVSSEGSHENLDNGNSGGNGSGGSKGGSGGGGPGDSSGGEGSGNDTPAGEFGPLLGLTKVQEIASKEGVQLPQDMLDYAASSGLPLLLLERYIALQKGFLAPFVRGSTALRDRLLADPSFLFKIWAEVAIDSCCATFAEVSKRGEDFWDEFELYASDLLVGIVLDVALVGLLAPTARLVGKGGVVGATGFAGKIAKSLGNLPNNMFEAALPGQKFTLGQRAATWFVKGAQYGVAGFFCGFVGQAIANGIIKTKRKLNKKEDGDKSEVEMPDVLPSALLWSVFMAVSSNTRYQIVNGLERVVETSVIGKRVPLVANAFTIAVRFGNNVYGGMQFVDWARWSGVQ